MKKSSGNVVLGLAAATLFGMIGYTIKADMDSQDEIKKMHTHDYVIQPGDYFWDIAKTYVDNTVDGMEKSYLREDLMSETRKRNPEVKNLGVVQPGQHVNLLCNGGTGCPNTKTK